MDLDIFEDAKDWEEIARKEVEKLRIEKDKEIGKQLKKIKELQEDVYSKKKEIEKLREQLRRLGRRNEELYRDNRQLKRGLDDAEDKFLRKKVEERVEKEKREKFVLELRERVTIEETERERVRRELKRRREDEKEYIQFQEFKKRKKSCSYSDY